MLPGSEDGKLSDRDGLPSANSGPQDGLPAQQQEHGGAAEDVVEEVQPGGAAPREALRRERGEEVLQHRPF